MSESVGAKFSMALFQLCASPAVAWPCFTLLSIATSYIDEHVTEGGLLEDKAFDRCLFGRVRTTMLAWTMTMLLHVFIHHSLLFDGRVIPINCISCCTHTSSID